VVGNPALNAVKATERLNAKFLSSMVQPLNTSTDDSFVQIHYFDVKDCSTKEIQYVVYKSGVCYASDDSHSVRWSCNGDKAHFEQWASLDCTGTSDGGNNFSPDSCFPQESSETYIQSTSFSCSASSVPAGEWYSTASYTDTACKDLYFVSHLANHYCMPMSGMYSMKIDWPTELYYMSSADCSSTPMKIDLSASANKCYPTTSAGVTTQATQMYFSQA